MQKVAREDQKECCLSKSGSDIFYLITCARGKAIGFVCHCLLSVVVTPDVGIWATRKYNEPVEICEKLALISFELFGKVHECHKYCVFIGHAYRLQVMCFLLMCTIVNLINA